MKAEKLNVVKNMGSKVRKTCLLITLKLTNSAFLDKSLYSREGCKVENEKQSVLIPKMDIRDVL